MPNHYNCSDGSQVTEATIKTRRSATYRKMYAGNPHPNCEGCGASAEGSAHLIPQKVAKDNGMTELCWLEENIVPACTRCNSILESYKGDEIKDLFCYEKALKITKKYLPERYERMIN